MISVAYTCVRGMLHEADGYYQKFCSDTTNIRYSVKQSIAWANILPFSSIWRRSGPLRAKFEKSRRADNAGIYVSVFLGDQGDNEEQRRDNQAKFAYTYPGTPEGGIVLHWIVTVFYIVITIPMKNLSDAIDLSANLLVYGHFFVEAFVAAGFIWFDPVQRAQLPHHYPTPGWLPGNRGANPPSRWMRTQPFSLTIPGLTNGIGQTVLGLLVSILSAAIVLADISEQKGQVGFGIVCGLLCLAWLYWFLLIREGPARKHLYDWFDYDVQLKSHGLDDHDDPSRFCNFCDHFLRRSQPAADLTSEHRHPHYSYLKFASIAVS
ncbi:hypothetical protein LX36DRAFT_376242 [Colletotrichum falcatum]|nr:hypothetical protein LX36DRAFT_376242 [Colletotrichum falcatum]